MAASIREIIRSYNPIAPLAEASTPPASWYGDARILELERTVFSRSWQLVGRADQVREPGQYVGFEIAGEPVVVVRGNDKVLRGFFNVCRHHAAAVITKSEGKAENLRCPYHGWTYNLEGALVLPPEFGGVANFDRGANGLVPIQSVEWQGWVFVKLDPDGPSLEGFLGKSLIERLEHLNLEQLRWFERRHYSVNCNWKVFVDNYLDGGYHVPFLHRGLNSVLSFKDYTIETFGRACLQSSPIVARGGEAATATVRQGRALYYWVYPNLMLNWYDGYLDTNLVVPLGVDRMKVVFDFYFADVSEAARAHIRQSIEVSGRIQDEDLAICASVQRGLASRAYRAGRLAPRREAGEHLFHRLLAGDLRKAG